METDLKAVAYYRVSTQKQKRSGLGLADQRLVVERTVKNLGGTIIAEFTEIESRRKNDRPALKEALQLVKKEKAKLIIAKLDRLSGNVAFTSALMEAKVPFLACDIPEADEFTIHLFAAIAQRECKITGQRTKAALQAKKAQGIKLGNPKLADARYKMALPKRMRAARKQTPPDPVATHIAKEMREKKAPYHEIAAKLNDLGFKAPKGGQMSATTVMRMI